MLQHLLPHTVPPVLQPQIGHGAPLTHLIPPGERSLQLLVSIDETWELKLWQISPDTAPVEYLSLPLPHEVRQAQWCIHTPNRLWCQDLQGGLGYYDFDLVNHQADFHAFANLPLPPHEGLGFYQSPDHLLMLSQQGLWQTATPTEKQTAEPPALLKKLSAPSEKDLSNALQAQITLTPDGLYIALLTAHQAQVFQCTASTYSSVFCMDLETPATPDTAFLLAQRGQHLAIDRQVYALQDPSNPHNNTICHTYYGRPLAFFDVDTPASKPCLLWASGDTLFTTDLSAQGEILHHQAMRYTERYRSWPIFWSFAVADTHGEAPTFWVADHHRHNASRVNAPMHSEALAIGHSLVGEGGWVESLCFTQHDRLYVGGGQKGTLCQLQLQTSQSSQPDQPVTLAQHYQAPPQPVESLWKIPLRDREILLTLSAGALRAYSAQQSEPFDIMPPPAPWHKALENGALEQLAVLPKGWVTQFSYKGKVSIQHYDIPTQRWHILSQKLPERALLLVAISEQELLMEHDNPTGFFKIYFPHTQTWQDLPSDFEGFDQVLWNNTQQLLAILLEGEIEIWHHPAPGQWVCCHHISQEAFFNGMAFSEQAAELWSLDNDGHFKHWRIQTANAPEEIGAPPLIKNTSLSHWGPEAEDRVVSISAEGTLIALGDRDQPLRLWNGHTGHLVRTLLACVNTEGTDTDIAMIAPKEQV